MTSTDMEIRGSILELSYILAAVTETMAAKSLRAADANEWRKLTHQLIAVAERLTP